MTILFIEGFENYNKVTDMAGIWLVTNVPNFLQTGRDASGSSLSLGVSDLIRVAITPTDPGWLGFAFKHDNTVSIEIEIVRFTESGLGTHHLALNLDTSGRFVLERGSVDIATSSKSIAAGVWYYLEMRWLIDDASGIFELYVNGKRGGWLNFSGDTRSDSAPVGTVDEIIFSGWTNGSGGPFYLDDLYILDENGTSPGNDRLGDSLVETLNPSGAGAEAQWSPSAGSNFQNVDEATPDDDTTFNSSAVVGDDDRFAMDNLVNVPSTVFAVQVNGGFRLENSGARDVRLKVHDGVTEGQSADFQPSFSSAYVFEFEMFEDHPTDANPWSTAEVNAMEAGYRIQA